MCSFQHVHEKEKGGKGNFNLKQSPFMIAYDTTFITM